MTRRNWWRCKPVSGVALALLFLLFLSHPTVGEAASFAGVLTYHNDNLRTGQNLSETILTPSNVNTAQFGLLFTAAVDAQIYAQPLYVPSVAIRGQGTHNIVIVTTENDSVYAFDADTAGSPLWHTSLLTKGEVPIPASDTGCGDLTPLIGSTSTGVIDPATNILYVTAATKETDGSYMYRLHALDITNGSEERTSPVVIQGSVPSTGPNANPNGQISLSAFFNNQRSALLLDGSVLYMAFSSHCDFGPYNGWVLGYNKTSLSQVALYSVDPNGTDGGIWMAGGGLATDASGDIYFSSGNGTFDANVTGGVDYGDSFLRLTPSGSSFKVNSYFTPNNQASLFANDQDLGSGALMLLPDQPTAPTHLAVGVGKAGELYMVNRDAMGGYQTGPGNSDNVIQENSSVGSSFSTPAYFNSNIYVAPASAMPQQYSLSNGLLSASPVQTFAVTFPWPGATPSISADGTANGIVWMIGNISNLAVLYALDASNISSELYDSSQNSSRDTAGTYNKFAVPTVANGKVYVGTQSRLAVYGLLSGSGPTPTSTATPTPMPTPSPENVVTVTHTVTGIAHPGASRNGGTFTLTNGTGGAETVGSVTVTFSNASMFKSAGLRATHETASRSAQAKPPAAQTVFTFKSPFKIPAKKSATFHLNFTAIKGATAPSSQAVTAIATSSSAPMAGLPGNLGSVSPPTK